jgi:DNA topoisomerase-1
VDLPAAVRILERAALGDQSLGVDPDSDLPVYLKSGRYGPYVQLGEDGDNDGKPRRSSLWPGMTPETLTLGEARMLLSFPRTLGDHPVTGEPITAQDGPLGPYVKMGTESRSLRDHDHLASVTLEDAVALLAEPRKGRARAASILADLGAHPDTGANVTIRNGRFGPYVTDGAVNASLPRGRNPATVTIEDAVDLIAAREAKLREQGKDPRAKTTATPRARASRAGTSRSSSSRSSQRKSA